METLERVEREVLTRDGRWLLMRAHPYRTADDRIDGVVLTFVDVTSRGAPKLQLQCSEARLRLVLESVADYAIYTLDPDGLIGAGTPAPRGCSAAWRTRFSASPRPHSPPSRIATPARIATSCVSPSSTARRSTSGGTCGRTDRRPVSGSLAPLLDGRGLVVGYVKVARDLTERK